MLSSVCLLPVPADHIAHLELLARTLRRDDLARHGLSPEQGAGGVGRCCQLRAGS
jgi:hypothetical protein